MTLKLELTAEEEDALLGEANGENQTPEFWARNALRYMLGLRRVLPDSVNTNGSGEVLEEPQETPVYVRRPEPEWVKKLVDSNPHASTALRDLYGLWEGLPVAGEEDAEPRPAETK